MPAIRPSLLFAATVLLLSCQPGPQLSGLSPTPLAATPAPDPSIAPSAEPTPALTPSPRPVVYVTEKPLTLLMTAASTTFFTLEVKDAAFNPVRTDLWLYWWNGSSYVPFRDFTVPGAKRRSANFMLPATSLGVPTGYEPADNGSLNGLMTDGAYRPDIDGVVDVTLTREATAGTKILVAAALEDQRYYGARVFDLPTGAASAAPLHHEPRQHVKRTYIDDVQPLLKKSCTNCHNTTFMPMESYEDLVTRGLYYNRTEYHTEPGAPALSGLVRRMRPGLGTEAKKWYGKQGWRWNFDFNGKIVADRRMPPQALDGEVPESDGRASYYDTRLDEYKILWDWVAQGAPER